MITSALAGLLVVCGLWLVTTAFKPIPPLPPETFAVESPTPRGEIIERGPNMLHIDSVGIHAKLGEPIHFDSDYVLLPSGDSNTANIWAEGAPLSADSGTTLITGHVQTWTSLKGVFWGLADVRPGDVISTSDANNETRGWVVTELFNVAKSELPSNVFSQQGSRRLILVTCGGPGQTENVVVTATPIN